MTRAMSGKPKVPPSGAPQLASELDEFVEAKLFTPRKGAFKKRDRSRSSESAQLEQWYNPMLLAAGILTESDIYKSDRPTFTAGSKFDLYTVAGHWFHSPCANFSTGPKTSTKNKKLFEMFLNGDTQEQIASALGRKQPAVHRTLQTLLERCKADYYRGKIPNAVSSWLKTHFSNGIPPDMEIAFFAAAATRSGIEYPYMKACEVYRAWLQHPGANFRTKDLSEEQNRQIFAMYATSVRVPEIVRLMNLPQAKICQTFKTLAIRCWKDYDDGLDIIAELKYRWRDAQEEKLKKLREHNMKRQTK